MSDAEPEGLHPSVLEGLIGYHLRRASSAVAADFARAVKGAGVRQVSFAVAAVIAANPGINQGAVGRALGVKRANMVALVNELVGAGIIDRRAARGDRRAFALTLTEEGERRYRSWVDRIRAHEDRLFAAFTPGERTILIELLSRLGEEE